MKEKPKSEKLIEHEILLYLRSHGVFCWKNITGGFFDPVRKRFRKQTSPYAINGTSDILGIMKDGRFLAIEVKSKYGKPSPEQTLFIQKIKANGGIAFVARSISEVEEFIK